MPQAPSKASQKKQVIELLFEHCQKSNDFVFDNGLVKRLCGKVRFGNPFDVTKLDNTDNFPDVLLENDYYIAHLGKGRHCFMPGIAQAYHAFEGIQDVREWTYRKSLLNEFDTSESNILSVAHNQLITHDFLYEDRRANPNMYMAKRTSGSFCYRVGQQAITTDKLQMEIDLTLEYKSRVTVFEGKNKFPDRFAVYQLYHPFLYYYELGESNALDIATIDCCYLLRGKGDSGSIIRVYLYTFPDPYDMASIDLQKSTEYRLVAR